MASELFPISIVEIQQDILDTRREIENMEAELKHFEATPPTSQDYRWNMMRASARRDGIVERLQFIAKLENLLKKRAGPAQVLADQKPTTEQTQLMTEVHRRFHYEAPGWKGESAAELVAKDICPKCFGALDTGWECNKCGFDASHLVKAERKV